MKNRKQKMRRMPKTDEINLNTRIKQHKRQCEEEFEEEKLEVVKCVICHSYFYEDEGTFTGRFKGFTCDSCDNVG